LNPRLHSPLQTTEFVAGHPTLIEVFAMKSIIRAVLIASALVIPVASFAQSTEHTTRAQVHAELMQLESVGYHVGDGDTTHYPDTIQAAEAKVAARDASTSTYGGASSSTSQSGSRMLGADWNAMYSR
jgi:mitochondrial fission protein ELM1